MTGSAGRRRAHDLTPGRKLITANVRPVVAESNLCLDAERADSVGAVPITEAPR